VRRSASFELQADGELTGSVTEKRFGDLSERRRVIFTRDYAKDQQKFMDDSIGRDVASAKVTDLNVENVAALNKDLTTTFTLDATRFATQVGPLMMVRPRVLGTFGFNLDRKRRSLPPAGYTVDELPDPVKLDVGFASYESSTELHGKTLHYSRTFTLRQVTLPAEKYPELQRLAGVIEADEQNRAVLKKTN